MIKVKEIFNSVQGEGRFVGVPMTFIRLSGCNVKCFIKKWCDTDYSSGDYMSLDDITDSAKLRHVCITGGEPLEQDILGLCKRLRIQGKQVHIQTSGMIEMDSELFANTNHVVCSPKMPVSRLKLRKCDEIKVVYNGQDIEQYYKYGNAMSHFIQPLEADGIYNIDSTISKLESMNPSHDWRLSLQTHKLIGVK